MTEISIDKLVEELKGRSVDVSVCVKGLTDDMATILKSVHFKSEDYGCCFYNDGVKVVITGDATASKQEISDNEQQLNDTLDLPRTVCPGCDYTLSVVNGTMFAIFLITIK